jgi:hypothetical protein
MWKASRRYSLAPPRPKHSAASKVKFDSGAYTRGRLARRCPGEGARRQCREDFSALKAGFCGWGSPSLPSGRIEIPAQAGRPRDRHAPRPDGGTKLPPVDLHQMQAQGADYAVTRSERTILIVPAECIADVVLKSCHALSAKQCVAHMGHMGSQKSDDRHRSWGSNAAVSLIRRHAS